MRNFKLIFYVFLLSLSLLAAGCWDSTPIEETDITTTVLVDKTKNGYAFYTEIASLTGNSGGGEGGGSAPQSKVMRAEGPSFVDAREGLERQGDKPVNLTGVQCVLFTERFLYSGINEYLYRFRQDTRYRKTAMVAATGENPDEIFAAASENNVLVGHVVNDTLDSLADIGQLYHFTMGDVLEVLACPCKGYLIPRIGLTEREKDIEVNGFYVMDGGVCLGIIPMEEGEFIVYIQGNVPPFRYAMPYNENSVTAELRLHKEPVKIEYAGGKIEIGLRFVCDTNLLYMNDDIKVDDAMMEEIGEELKRQLTEEFICVIRTSQEMFQLDYLKFHEAFRIHYPDAYKEMDWKEEYPKARITVDVAVNIKGSNIDYEPEE